jgi:hypothetical protein
MMSYQQALNELFEIQSGLAGKMKADEEKVAPYISNQEQAKKLGEFLSALQDPKDKDKGIIPAVNNATQYAVTNRPDGLIRSGVQAYSAQEAIKGLKDYVTSAKGKLKEILYTVLLGLYMQAQKAADTVKTVANTPVMAPQVDKVLQSYHAAVGR